MVTKLTCPWQRREDAEGLRGAEGVRGAGAASPEMCGTLRLRRPALLCDKGCLWTSRPGAQRPHVGLPGTAGPPGYSS